MLCYILVYYWKRFFFSQFISITVLQSHHNRSIFKTWYLNTHTKCRCDTSNSTYTLKTENSKISFRYKWHTIFTRINHRSNTPNNYCFYLETTNKRACSLIYSCYNLNWEYEYEYFVTSSAYYTTEVKLFYKTQKILLTIYDDFSH